MPRTKKRKAPKRRAVKSPLLRAVIDLARADVLYTPDRQQLEIAAQREILKALPADQPDLTWWKDQRRAHHEAPRRRLQASAAPELFPFI